MENIKYSPDVLIYFPNLKVCLKGIGPLYLSAITDEILYELSPWMTINNDFAKIIIYVAFTQSHWSGEATSDLTPSVNLTDAIEWMLSVCIHFARQSNICEAYHWLTYVRSSGDTKSTFLSRYTNMSMFMDCGNDRFLKKWMTIMN